MRRIRLVHMGDSITVGQHVDPSKRWTTLVAQWATEAYAPKGIVIESVNCGVSGETTRIGLERFPAAIQTVEPNILTLQYGLNDCNCWQIDKGLPRVSQAAFKANLIEMVDRARCAGAREIILATNHPTLRYSLMLNGERYEDANSRYSEVIREVAGETQVVLCDIRKAFAGYTDEELEELLLPAPDHLHLSVEGNRVYAEAIWPCVDQAIQNVVERAEEELRA